jgi:hypothetical membrane protein
MVNQSQSINSKNLLKSKKLASFTIVGIVIYILMDILVQLLPPHYNPLIQAESDLAVGPYGYIMNINFIVRGLLSIALILSICHSADQKYRTRIGIGFLSIWGICSLLLAFFNTDIFSFSQPNVHLTFHGKMHLILAAIAFICAPIGQILVTISFRKMPLLNSFIIPSIILSLFTLLSFIIMVPIDMKTPYLGLTERIFIGFTLLWFLVVAIKIRGSVEHQNV